MFEGKSRKWINTIEALNRYALSFFFLSFGYVSSRLEITFMNKFKMEGKFKGLKSVSHAQQGSLKY